MKRVAILTIILLSLCLSSCTPLRGTDHIDTKSVKNYQFVVFKSDGGYHDIDYYCVGVVGFGDAASEMKDGEFALVTADVERKYGGVAGFKGDTTIENLISFEIISSEEAFNKVPIPEIGENGISHEYDIYMYHSGENIYCVFFDRGNYYVYLNEALIDEYKELDKMDDLTGFLDSLAESENVQDDKSS